MLPRDAERVHDDEHGLWSPRRSRAIRLMTRWPTALTAGADPTPRDVPPIDGGADERWRCSDRPVTSSVAEADDVATRAIGAISPAHGQEWDVEVSWRQRAP